MRNFMKIVEAHVVDGYVSGPSAKELAELVRNKGDLRGVAHGDKVFLAPAYEELHFGMRDTLGLPAYLYDPETDEKVTDYGFDFYVAATASVMAGEKVNDDGGRSDWTTKSEGQDEPDWTVGEIGIWTSEGDALANRQFARMVKTSINESFVETSIEDYDPNEFDDDVVEVEFVCINPCTGGTEPERANTLYESLKQIPDILIYRQDFLEEGCHWAMCAVIDKHRVSEVADAARRAGVEIDLVKFFPGVSLVGEVIDIWSNIGGSVDYRRNPSLDLPPATKAAAAERAVANLSESLTESAYRFRLGKNLGRVNFKAFFDNVMAQRPKFLARGSDEENPYLLESDDMILRGSMSADGKSVVCDAWLATHATTYDAVYDLSGNEGTIDFWVDDKMVVHWRSSDFEKRLAPTLKKLAEQWGAGFVIDKD